jgi:hypothetical protein
MFVLLVKVASYKKIYIHSMPTFNYHSVLYLTPCSCFLCIMKTWRVYYQMKTAPKTFYPKDIEVDAMTRRGARQVALKQINENTDFDSVEKIIITKIELI